MTDDGLVLVEKARPASPQQFFRSQPPSCQGFGDANSRRALAFRPSSNRSELDESGARCWPPAEVVARRHRRPRTLRSRAWNRSRMPGARGSPPLPANMDPRHAGRRANRGCAGRPSKKSRRARAGSKLKGPPFETIRLPTARHVGLEPLLVRRTAALAALRQGRRRGAASPMVWAAGLITAPPSFDSAGPTAGQPYQPVHRPPSLEKMAVPTNGEPPWKKRSLGSPSTENRERSMSSCSGQPLHSMGACLWTGMPPDTEEGWPTNDISMDHRGCDSNRRKNFDLGMKIAMGIGERKHV